MMASLSMRLFAKYCLLFVPLLLMASCNSPDAPDCLKSTGRTTIVERYTGSVPRVLEVYDNIDVYLTQDSATEIRIEGGKNILPDVKLEEKAAGHYVLRNRNTCNWVRSYKRKIKAHIRLSSDLEDIHLHGGGDIRRLC